MISRPATGAPHAEPAAMRQIALCAIVLSAAGCGQSSPLPSGDAGSGSDLSAADGPASTPDLTGDPADLSSQPKPDLADVCGGFGGIQCPNGTFCEIDDRSCG